MNNVIEQLPDTPRVLARCRDLLRSGGRLVVVTPNISSQCHDIFGACWRGLEVPRHLHLFTAASLRGIAKAAAFSSIQDFSPPNGAQVDTMIEASSEIAERSGGRALTGATTACSTTSQRLAFDLYRCQIPTEQITVELMRIKKHTW